MFSLHLTLETLWPTMANIKILNILLPKHFLKEKSLFSFYKIFVLTIIKVFVIMPVCNLCPINITGKYREEQIGLSGAEEHIFLI